jgi:signal transduction histidine kinase
MSGIGAQLRTTTFAVTLRYMVLFFISVTLLMAVINWAIINYVEERADENITNAARTFALMYQQGGPAAAEPLMRAWRSVEDGSDSLYVLANGSFERIAGNLSAWPQLSPVDEGWVQFAFPREDGTQAIARGRVIALGRDGWLLMAREARDLGGLERVLDRAFILILGITLVLALLGGLLMSNNVLRRVNQINATSRKIMGGNLSLRMPTGDGRDEFDELSSNLNAMLDQIEGLINSVRHVSDNIAHDLRTPLTRLRNRLEGLRARMDDASGEEIDACLDDADQLLATFASLLSIARIESGASDASLENLDLGSVVGDACELYQALAEDKDIRLNCRATPGYVVRGDRNLVFQALINLLDNAIKYTPAGGQVDVTLEDQNGKAAIRVTDTGPGIPAERHDQVVQRFYRLDESRSAPGAGLGLSLVKAIAQRHEARLLLEDRQPGLAVTLSFPRIAVS